MEYVSSERKLLPYGMMNFADIRLDNYYYVDKTSFIPVIEHGKTILGGSGGGKPFIRAHWLHLPWRTARAGPASFRDPWRNASGASGSPHAV